MALRVKTALALALVSGGVASAQVEVIVPNNMATTTGAGGLNTVVRDAGNPRSYQIIYASSELTSAVGMDLVGISWRMLPGYPAFPSTEAVWNDYQIRVGTAATTPATMSTSFAANFSGNEVLVRSGPLTLPAGFFPVLGSPNPFGDVIPFHAPFTYTGGDLVIDIRHPGGNFTNPNGYLEGLATTQAAQGYGITTRAMSQSVYPTPTTGAFATAYISKLFFTSGNPNVTGACCFNDGSCQFITLANCQAGGGSFRGENVTCAAANCPQPGACCFPSGSCEVRFELACTGSGGTWSGAGTSCTPNTCPQPGACWLSDGCAIVMEGVCTFAGGTFQGGASNCASFPLPAGVLYINGPMATGASSGNGIPAPGGNQWSECAHPYEIPTFQAPANTTAGFRVASATDRIADDFTIPAGESWQINNVVVYAYQTGSSTTSSFTGATLRIWDGPPNVSGSTVVWGDTSTNRMTSTQFSGIYRAFSSVVAPACGGAVTQPTTDRPIMEVVVGVNASLPAGTYWLDYNTTGTLASGPWAPLTTVRGTRTANAAANALQSTNNGLTWVLIQDAGQGCNPTPITQDYAFRIRGERTSACYANCDNSTTPPILNVEDFTCFINQFAAASQLPPAQQLTHYANCDQSTTPPVLNVEDFTCFINKFAQGCP
jgi:hypothetical protein